MVSSGTNIGKNIMKYTITIITILLSLLLSVFYIVKNVKFSINNTNTNTNNNSQSQVTIIFNNFPKELKRRMEFLDIHRDCEKYKNFIMVDVNKCIYEKYKDKPFGVEITKLSDDYLIQYWEIEVKSDK